MNKIFLFIISYFLLTLPCFALIEDEFVNKTISPNTQKPTANEKYDYSSTTCIPVKLKITEKINSENELYEGQILNLLVKKSVIYNDKVIVKYGTKVTAKVETIITNGMNGIPASIVLGDFKIPSLDSNKLSGSYEKYGMDLSLLVYPIKWALTPFPPIGSLTNFIKGGHVKITPNTDIIIYYYPEWL